ncbi:Alpha/Beta hydrolase protein [Crucibulum laeve]|uniref:Alpha/Beta hydrolase protein n=1 Tax=Crucibulum laeve TaxID=68775 RepID=A0A5C3M5Z5_9AGAR|nr:Alpha/Beta hydrolase protein [Crucibulum laeve]
MNTVKETVHIGGITIHVYQAQSTAASSCPLVAFFLLHGRYGSAIAIDNIAKRVVDLTKDCLQQNLLVITFDHRNHGTRMVNAKANDAWSTEHDRHNERHAVDMYSIQSGTARDVSFVIDFLPAYLYPMGDRAIVEWGVAGISLGGHSTWLSLTKDKRIKTGIPIIGCADYIKLIEERAQRSKIPNTPPYFPVSFLALVKQSDPLSTPYDIPDESNPFWGKNILVLSGEADRLVPWSASEEFVKKLQVGPGMKKISVHKDVGHECTEQMVEEMATFIKEVVLDK